MAGTNVANLYYNLSLGLAKATGVALSAFTDDVSGEKTLVVERHGEKLWSKTITIGELIVMSEYQIRAAIAEHNQAAHDAVFEIYETLDWDTFY